MSDSEQNEQVINWPAALEGAANDKDLLDELVTLFLDESQKNLSDIRKALDEGNAELLKRAAHTLKGSLRIFQSFKAQDLAFQLEKKGENNSMESADSLLAQLLDQMKLVRAELEKGYHD